MSVQTTQPATSIVIEPELPEIQAIDLEPLTERQRRIVMEYKTGNHDSIYSIRRKLCEDQAYVKAVLCKHFDALELPYGKNGLPSTPERSWHDLTEKQQRLIDEFAQDESISFAEAGRRADASGSYAKRVRNQYAHFVEQRRRELNPGAVVRDELLAVRDEFTARIDGLLAEL